MPWPRLTAYSRGCHAIAASLTAWTTHHSGAGASTHPCLMAGNSSDPIAPGGNPRRPLPTPGTSAVARSGIYFSSPSAAHPGDLQAGASDDLPARRLLSPGSLTRAPLISGAPAAVSPHIFVFRGGSSFPGIVRRGLTVIVTRGFYAVCLCPTSDFNQIRDLLPPTKSARSTTDERPSRKT